MLELGLAEMLSSEPLRPDRLLEAFETAPDPGARLLAAHALARTYYFGDDPPAGTAIVRRALDELPATTARVRLGSRRCG